VWGLLNAPSPLWGRVGVGATKAPSLSGGGSGWGLLTAPSPSGGGSGWGLLNAPSPLWGRVGVGASRRHFGATANHILLSTLCWPAHKPLRQAALHWEGLP